MLILGMDVGGTRARCLVADLTGRRVGLGEGGGGNPVSRGIPMAMAQIRAAIEQALVGVDRSDIAASVIGVAGFGDDAEAGAAFREMWAGLEIGSPAQLTHDASVAFAAGTPAARGTVLVSGTGAAAAEMVDGQPARVADGIGWLLGDDGSGFWVGREAVRHALRPALGRPDDPLTVAVERHLLGRRGSRDELLQAAYAGQPVALSALAPVVVEIADAGDPDAQGVLTAAAHLLEASAVMVRDPGDATPIVLSGGMFGAERLTGSVTALLTARWPEAPISRATNGAGGAAWLAARSLRRELPPTLHEDLTRDL